MREAHTICSPTTSGPETPMKTWPALMGSEKTSQQEERGCTTVCQHLHSFLRTNSLPSAHREKSTENKWKGQSPIPQQCPCVTWGWLFSTGRDRSHKPAVCAAHRAQRRAGHISNPQASVTRVFCVTFCSKPSPFQQSCCGDRGGNRKGKKKIPELHFAVVKDR